MLIWVASTHHQKQYIDNKRFHPPIAVVVSHTRTGFWTIQVNGLLDVLILLFLLIATVNYIENYFHLIHCIARNVCICCDSTRSKKNIVNANDRKNGGSEHLYYWFLTLLIHTLHLILDTQSPYSYYNLRAYGKLRSHCKSNHKMTS